MIPPVIDASWLAQRPDALLVDVRWYPDGRSARQGNEAAHLPDAVFVDLDNVLAGPAGEHSGRHPLPDPVAFAAAMGALGIGDDDLVVAYDDAGGVIAARLVWMLRATGHDAALLDGGLASGRPVTSAPARGRGPATFTTRAWPRELLATIDEVAHLAGDTDHRDTDHRDTDHRPMILLDARPAERYRGAPDALDPVAGHIPGAVSVPARGNVDATGYLLPVGRLRERFAAVGVQEGTDVISSCGSGVTACHTLLLLEHAGLGTGRLFPGSWSQWSRDHGRPVATGESPR